jgi:SPP1 family predicted phage head-tail adaptor
MKAGKLRHRIVFSRRVPGQDDVGQPDTAFAPLFTAWGSADPLTGREFFAAATNVDQVDTQIQIRVDSRTLPLKATDRATVAGGQGGVFDIVAVLMPEQAGRSLRIMAKRTT